MKHSASPMAIVSGNVIKDLINFHKQQNTLATLTASQPPGRFGAIYLGENKLELPASVKA